MAGITDAFIIERLDLTRESFGHRAKPAGGRECLIFHAVDAQNFFIAQRRDFLPFPVRDHIAIGDIFMHKPASDQLPA